MMFNNDIAEEGSNFKLYDEHFIRTIPELQDEDVAINFDPGHRFVEKIILQIYSI